MDQLEARARMEVLESEAERSWPSTSSKVRAAATPSCTVKCWRLSADRCVSVHMMAPIVAACTGGLTAPAAPLGTRCVALDACVLDEASL
jgi:hypothetical protein